MPENLPELALDDDFSSEAYEPDEKGVYRIVEYFRKYDNTRYMRSTLSNDLGEGRYGTVTLTYFDTTGDIPLHNVRWRLGYDLNKKITSKRVE